MIVIKGTTISYSEWEKQSVFKKIIRRIRIFFKLKVPVICAEIPESTKKALAEYYARCYDQYIYEKLSKVDFSEGAKSKPIITSSR